MFGDHKKRKLPSLKTHLCLQSVLDFSGKRWDSKNEKLVWRAYHVAAATVLLHDIQEFPKPNTGHPRAALRACLPYAPLAADSYSTYGHWNNPTFKNHMNHTLVLHVQTHWTIKVATHTNSWQQQSRLQTLNSKAYGGNRVNFHMVENRTTIMWQVLCTTGWTEHPFFLLLYLQEPLAWKILSSICNVLKH